MPAFVAALIRYRYAAYYATLFAASAMALMLALLLIYASADYGAP